MKSIITICVMMLFFLQFSYSQEKEYVIIKTKNDLKINDLYGKYKADGYYFQIMHSVDDHLFAIKYEMHWYDETKHKRVILDKCEGFVDLKEDKLFLTWLPCETKGNDVKIISNKAIEFKFFKDNYPVEEKDENIFFLEFEGGPMPLLESVAAGLIPISTNVGFAQELLTEFGYNRQILKSPIKFEDIIQRFNYSYNTQHRKNASLLAKKYSLASFSNQIQNNIEISIGMKP
jgi:hypothetical protein